MPEQSKRERFIATEVLDQVGNLVEPLSNCFGTPMILFDADGEIRRQSTLSLPCFRVTDVDEYTGTACEQFYRWLQRQLRSVYDDVPVMHQCHCGTPITAFPIKTGKQFIGMLCFGNSVSNEQLASIRALLNPLLEQMTEAGRHLGEVVSQLLEFQNRVTLSDRFIRAANGKRDIDALFQTALEVIQKRINPGEALIIIPATSNGQPEVVYTIGADDQRWKAEPFLTPEHEVIRTVLQGTPVVMNTYGEKQGTEGRAHNLLAMPIQIHNEILGAIILIDKMDHEIFLADDERFVESLGRSLGSVLKQIQLAQKLVDAEKASVEQQKEIVARVVHKMRNVFVAMKGNTKWVNEIIKDDGNIERADLESAVDGINRNSRDAGKIITGFLNYVSPEQFQPEYTDVPSLVAEISANMGRALDGALRIKSSYASNLPELRIDIGLFRASIEEMIMNAYQHLDGSGVIRLRVDRASDAEIQIAHAPADKSFIVVEVSDNGPGIPNEVKPKIFNLSFSTRAMGTGLGLALVKRDIQRHGGYITEVGREGQGADFRILLPIPVQS
jgi:signal transduction histidine kinase